MRGSARTALAAVTLLIIGAPAAQAGDTLCDTAYQDCRTPLLELIANEQVRIDVAFWFMEDARYTAALKRKIDEGVPVRVLVDTRANGPNPLNADRLAELDAAGIPMRRRTHSGILHWKMMLFAGQNTLEFSAANYSDSFVPYVPYENYIDEAVYFTDDASVVNSFRTKFDDLWTDEVNYADYANVTRPLERAYGIFPRDPELNFAPKESYRSRARARYDAETQAIDIVMYRITDRAHTDAMIRAIERGVTVRLITEPQQYRDPRRLWHSWNVDRLYMAGAQIRHRAHDGLLHQKSVILHGQRLTIFGSSNWSSASSDSQEEHNYFTTKPYFYDWFSAQFEYKWNNSAPAVQTEPFVPLRPDRPEYVSPANLALDQPLSVTLTWNAGMWAHLYDIYLGTTSDPPLLASDRPLGPSINASNDKSFTVSGLTEGTTYYWRVVAKTMALQENPGPVFSFTTAGTAPPPPPDGTIAEDDVVLYAAHAAVVAGNWALTPDGTAAGGTRIVNPDAGLPKATTAAAAPDDYFELTFTAEAGRAYHLWVRGRAQNDHWSNDSVHVQFSDSVNASGIPIFRIGTTSSTVTTVETGSGAGLSGWGWEDNGWDGHGADIFFESTGVHTIRIQRREDGISIDQIVLSPSTFLTAPPGASKNDQTILPEQDGSGGEPPPPPPPPPPGPIAEDDVVLYAAHAGVVAGNWAVTQDGTAAGGARMANPDAGLAKATTPAAAPDDYFELTFTAEAGRAYHLWVRGRAQNDHWSNDSVHLQFSDSVTASGTPVFRIGTTSSTVTTVETGSGAGLSGWGWEDNGWDGHGADIFFESTGVHTIRIQRREDGISIDQIVLSPSTFLTSAPGATKNDATILPEQDGSGDEPPPPPPPPTGTEADQVLYAAAAAIAGVDWSLVSDPTAAASTALMSVNRGAPKVFAAQASPGSYAELQFHAEAGTAYRLWIRGRAESDHWQNDSVHVQFSGSVDSGGNPLFRIGTTDSTVVNLEDCNGCGESGWGWQDNGWGVGVMGPLIYFSSSGTHTVRIQNREDGFAIDQIVLSSEAYVTSSPGALKNDTTILPATGQ